MLCLRGLAFRSSRSIKAEPRIPILSDRSARTIADAYSTGEKREPYKMIQAGPWKKPVLALALALALAATQLLIDARL